jgi:hypothetical protein
MLLNNINNYRNTDTTIYLGCSSCNPFQTLQKLGALIAAL